jgi:tripartite-type tricarboxylate transporter receptor subunit TctC
MATIEGDAPNDEDEVEDEELFDESALESNTLQTYLELVDDIAAAAKLAADAATASAANAQAQASADQQSADAAAKADPDGYSILVGSVSNIAFNMGLYDKLSYDSLRDFEPVGLAVSYSYTLMARKDLPINSLKDLVAFAKANPGKLSYASAGIGSGQHVLPAALWHLAGTDLVHVPYRGAQAAYLDLLGGRVDLFFDLSSTARVHVNAGSVKALAVSGAERNPMHPDVPTILESGVAPLDLESWFGYFVPKKTPMDIQDRLRSELAKVIAQPDLQETFRKAGGKPLNLNADQTRALVRRDVERWSKLVRDIGIKAE